MRNREGGNWAGVAVGPGHVLGYPAPGSRRLHVAVRCLEVACQRTQTGVDYTSNIALTEADILHS